MTIQEWPLEERPRERLIQQGCEALSDAELLAIILGNGTKGKTAIDLARQLIQRFQGLRGLFSADIKSFCQLPGLGLAKYSQIQAALELSRRHLKESIVRNNAFTNPKQTKTFLMASLRNHECEVFACLFLDNQHRLICFEKLFHGTINLMTVHPREVVKRALQHNAAAVIVAHNHPSGVTTPSQADRELTQRLRQSLDLVDIRLLDHFIVGDTSVISFAEFGFI